MAVDRYSLFFKISCASFRDRRKVNLTLWRRKKGDCCHYNKMQWVPRCNLKEKETGPPHNVTAERKPLPTDSSEEQ